MVIRFNSSDNVPNHRRLGLGTHQLVSVFKEDGLNTGGVSRKGGKGQYGVIGVRLQR